MNILKSLKSCLHFFNSKAAFSKCGDNSKRKMSFIGDALSYVAYRNPVSNSLLSLVGLNFQNGKSAAQPVVHYVQKSLWETAGNHKYFVRLAGFCGITAVLMSVYGKMVIAESDDALVISEGKAYFEVAQRYHFWHSVALMAVPLTHRPLLTGSLMLTGTLFFCSATYYRALTGNKNLSKLASYSGLCLLAAWMSLMF